MYGSPAARKARRGSLCNRVRHVQRSKSINAAIARGPTAARLLRNAARCQGRLAFRFFEFGGLSLMLAGIMLKKSAKHIEQFGSQKPVAACVNFCGLRDAGSLPSECGFRSSVLTLS